MSTKPLTCPWCQSSNLPHKLALRGGRCRTCSHRVQDGLDYLRTQAKARRAAKTKKAKRAVRVAAQASPAYRQMRAAEQAARRARRAERAYATAWQRMRLAVDEHELKGVVSAARALAQADQTLTRAQRTLTALQAQHPAPEPATGHRAIILPDTV